MLSSASRRSIKSPIGMVPYDVLLEILVHCLPLEDRFEIRQPNTKIAPLLLCQICTSWRTIALATPILWSHLSFCFTLRVFPGEWAFFRNEIEFIRWWKKHQGSIAPSLRLAIERDDDKSGALAQDKRTFVFLSDYMTTAQHLEIDPQFWERVPAVHEDHLTFPNLHTLVTYEYLLDYRADHYFRHTFSALRRLAIVDIYTEIEDSTIPAQWSTLTHLSITVEFISHDFWVHLTSTAP
ncbi:hypothetical protein BJ912DRAFT_907185, partial [Pholiota molesta]